MSVLSFIGSVCAPDKACNWRPYNAIFSNLLKLARYVVLVLTWWVFTPSALLLAIELQHVRPRLAKAVTKSKRLVDTIGLLFSLYLSSATLHGQ